MESRGAASAVVVTAMSVGSIGSLWLTSWLLQYCHWRTLLLGYSLFGIFWSVLFYLVFRSSPAEAPWLRDPLAGDSIDGAGGPAQEDAAPSLAIVDMLLNLSFWAMFVQMIFKAAGYNLLVTYFPAYLDFAYHVSQEEAGRMTSWSLIAVIFGSMAGGRCIDSLQRLTGRKWISRCGTAAGSLILTACLMWLATFARNATEMALAIAISSLVLGMANPCSWVATIDIGGKNTAVIMGFLNMGGALSGILITPLVGRLIDNIKRTDGDWNLVILVHAAFYVTAAVCWLLVNPERSLNSRENHDAV
jgi:predicted MFS family arabinose efflux permease